MTIETWLFFVAASLTLTMTPGPSILLGVIHSIKYGARKTIFTALGDISANFIQMMIVAIGLGVVISNSEVAFNIIKWFGVVTLLYVGAKMFFGSLKLESTAQSTPPDSIAAHKLFFAVSSLPLATPKPWYSSPHFSLSLSIRQSLCSRR